MSDENSTPPSRKSPEAKAPETKLQETKAPAQKRASTIVDVAERAGVAIGTVSRYLNGASIRRGNRDQIEQAIAALGYRRNAVATAMKTDRTHIIGLVVPAFDDFHARMLEHLALAIRRTGRALLTYCHSNDPRVLREALDFFATQRVDALIMDGTHVVYDQIDAIIERGVPVIFYNNEVAGLAADRVLVDNETASARAVGHLIDLGHRRIATLAGSLRDSTAIARQEGFRAAMRDGGLEIEPRFAFDGDWGAAHGYAAAEALMALSDPPTALFAANYQIAVGALTFLKQRALSLPEHVSLVSFDDVALFRLYGAGITAIAQPVARIAESITDLLVLRLTEADAPTSRTVTLDCDLILRGSTGRVR